MDATEVLESQGRERRRERRVWVAGIAVLQGGAQAPSVWRVTNLSQGGASLVGDGGLPSGKLSFGLHAAGFPAVDLEAKVLRRQLVTRAGKCGVKFVGVSEAQKASLREIIGADHTPAIVRRRALVVDREETRGPVLSGELASLGFTVRRATSPEQAAAWLQRETTEVLLVGERVLETNRWNLLQFVRDTAPEIRRFVLASDVRGFRLYYAIKAGLVDGLVEPKMVGDTLARHLLGAAPAKSRAPRRRVARSA
jgi:ActR/RegA family two-component response regulator